jgi:hypothetical protein
MFIISWIAPSTELTGKKNSRKFRTAIQSFDLSYSKVKLITRTNEHDGHDDTHGRANSMTAPAWRGKLVRNELANDDNVWIKTYSGAQHSHTYFGTVESDMVREQSIVEMSWVHRMMIRDVEVSSSWNKVCQHETLNTVTQCKSLCHHGISQTIEPCQVGWWYAITTRGQRWSAS